MADGVMVTVGVWEIALASGLVLLSAGLSAAMRLGLTRSILTAALRTVVQLGLLGLILKWVFAAQQWYVVVAIVAVMTVVAGLAVPKRARGRYRGIRSDALATVWLTSWTVAAVALFAVLRIRPWYSPQFVIPIVGLILGNTLTGVALTFDTLLRDALAQRGSIEMRLSLGATAWEAFEDTARTAVAAGMLPTLNSMMVVGLVSLPGMMTGQILAGGDPAQAVGYQILTMFMICAGTTLGCLMAAFCVFRRIFVGQSLRVDQIQRR